MSVNRHNPDGYTLLIQELATAWEHIEGQYTRNREMTHRIEAPESSDQLVDEFAWAALGYTIHNLYNAVENYFLRISKFFENSLPNEGWHKELINRMTYTMENLRPALFSKEHTSLFQELRAFRHGFRNLYDTRLNEDRVTQVNRLVPAAVELLSQAHLQFTARMQQIRAGLE